MAKHQITDKEGKAIRGPHGGKTFSTDKDGDSPAHQKIYEETRHGSKRVEGTHYDPNTGRFHKG